MKEVKQKKSPWVIGVFSFFLILVAVEATIVTIAFKTNNGVIEDQPYEKGVAYQETVDLLSATIRDVVSLNLEFKEFSQEKGKKIASVKLKKQGQLFANASVRLELIRADGKVPNQKMVLEEDSNVKGLYLSSPISINSGLWLFSAYISDGLNYYLVKSRVMT